MSSISSNKPIKFNINVESFVSYKTAKLLKNKGFDIEEKYNSPFTQYYTLNSNYKLSNDYYLFPNIKINLKNQGSKSIVETIEHKTNKDKDILLAPTQSLTQKWIREKMGVQIQIDYNFSLKKYDVIVYKDLFEALKKSRERITLEKELLYIYNTYEEALEAGLQQALLKYDLKNMQNENKK